MSGWNILYVTSADFDATIAPTVRARGLARALSRQGCRVTLMGINGDPTIEGKEPYRYVRISYPPRRYLGHLTYQAYLAARLTLERDAYDFLIVRETPYSWQPFVKGPPVFLEVNGLAIEEARLNGADGWTLRTAEAFYRWGYARARAIFALTPRIRTYLVSEMRADPGRVVTVTNAVELDRFYPMDRREARRVLGLPNGRWVFYVGSYHPQHGLHHVLEAAELLRHTDIRFLMAGAGDASFRERVAHRHLEDSFRFLGRVSDDKLRLAMAASNACLNPAGPETRRLTDATFPQKLLEYLACGRAVLAVGDAPQIRDVLDGTGMMVPPAADLGSILADRLVHMLSDLETLDRMGNAGMERVRRDFGYDRVVRNYIEEFRRRL